MNKIVLLIIMVSVCCSGFKAQEIVPLWDAELLTSNGITEAERLERNGEWLTNVTTPELYIYKAQKNPNGLAVVICPGGGYAGLAIEHEGKVFAQWLNERGITAVVLKYRMPNKYKEIPLADAHQAMKYVRVNADKLGVKPDKVGIAGFSAGGHLSATASNHYAATGVNTRPDFSILFYPVITMDKATHNGSKLNLLGDQPSLADVHQYSLEKQVSVNTPPTILLLSDDDKSVLPQNSTDYYNALKINDIPASMYVFPVGGHGWGFREDFKYHTEMCQLLEKWLEQIK